MEKVVDGKRSLFHKEIGEITYTRVRRSRSIRIALRPGKPVSVTLPLYGSYADADRLILEKLDWIKAELIHMREMEAKRKVFTEEELERLRAQAKQFLPPRVEALAQRHGFTYRGIAIKNIRSRWGSCSATNNLNFSIYLMYLPDDQVDYVILHELCHTMHKNHGPHFWALLDKVTSGRAKQLSESMSRYSRRLF
ncbi:MAG: M48 family metallopeptidase [Prevotellaceae bacterium]|nr:M48 family metallopeptidase [Prevotellaceae bacterium]